MQRGCIRTLYTSRKAARAPASSFSDDRATTTASWRIDKVAIFGKATQDILARCSLDRPQLFDLCFLGQGCNLFRHLLYFSSGLKIRTLGGQVFLAGRQGLEPCTAGLESAVLPDKLPTRRGSHLAIRLFHQLRIRIIRTFPTLVNYFLHFLLVVAN